MFITGGSFSGHQIERSLRFRSGASAYAARTPAAVHHSQKVTISFWIKRGFTGTGVSRIFSSDNGAVYDTIQFENDTLNYVTTAVNNGNSYGAVVVGVYRDPTAWTHWTIVEDTTQATASNRLRFFKNGDEVASSGRSSGYPLINSNSGFGRNWLHQVGAFTRGGGGFFDGYLAEFNVVIGQALSPTAFGQFDSFGNWTAKRYSGSYGTNGFYLPFKDTSSTANLVKDESGNGDNFTPYNISLTTGPTYDSMLDTPSNNYCVLNPLNIVVGDFLLTEGNLRVGSSNAPSGESCFSTIAFDSDKFYAEVQPISMNSAYVVGICPTTIRPNQGFYNQSGGVAYYLFDGTKFVNGVNTAYGSAVSSGAIVGIQVNRTANTVEFFVNGVSQGVISTTMTGPYVFAAGDGSGAAIDMVWNFGQRPFAYPVPAGFKTLCTANLPEPSIRNPKKHFDVALTASSGAYNGGQFQPDLVWVKPRNLASSNRLHDSMRGASKVLYSDATNAEATNTNSLASFDANGFTLGSDFAGVANVSWLWKAGGSTTTTNNAGSITSQVSVNPSAGFSIVTYTGSLTTTGSASIGHGLGVTPKMIISKSRNVAGSDAGSWMVQHVSLGTDDFLYLNSTSAAIDSVATGGGQLYKPTSGAFYSTWNSGGALSGNNYVAYCFAEIPGFSRFGSYTGNGSADGPFVHCGFRPRFVMIKRIDDISNWNIYDTARNISNVDDNVLAANLSNSEFQISADMTSNGFKLRDAGGSATNASGGTYIFAAFAEAPFKYANAR